MNEKYSAIPWGDDATWAGVNRTVTDLTYRYDTEFRTAREIAQSLATHFRSVFAYLDDLCINTCPWCPSPCCLNATVWIDFKDLLFLHFAGCAVPLKQLIESPSDQCRYAGPRGCTLARLCRPWICSWYICGTQQRLLASRAEQARASIDWHFQEIKRLRRDLEKEFVAVTI